MTFRHVSALMLGVSLLLATPVFARNNSIIDDVAHFKTGLLKTLDAKQFAELEALEEKLRQSKERFVGGDWKLFHFYEVLSAGRVVEHAPIESDWLAVIASLKEWQTQSPKSGVPSLLLADAYASYAWYARGTGFSQTVKEDAWAVFKDRLNQGAFHLNASRRLLPNHPQWYVTALVVARGLQWPRARAETLVAELAAIEPLYQHAYSTMATFLLPRWFGEPGEWENFAQQTAERIGRAEGSAVYNHIILQVSTQYGSKEFFTDSNVTWRKIQSSFDAREKLYGTGIQSLNAMCRLAGGVDDKAAARDCMKRVGDAWDQSVWRTRQNFDRFKKWVEGE